MIKKIKNNFVQIMCMRRKIILLAVCFLANSLAYASHYGILSVNDIKLSVSVRQDFYDFAFRTITQINWNDKKKIFLFYETKLGARLFVLDELGTIEIFQQPKLQINYLLNPQKYIQNRKKRVLEIDMNSCYLKVEKKDVVTLIYDMIKNKWPYVYKKYDGLSNDGVLLGYYGKDDFIFMEDTYQNFEAKDKIFFSDYFRVFSLLKNNPFNIVMEKCK
jgi:hypothetical protein